MQHYHKGVASITGRRIRNVSVYPGLHHYVVLHPGLVCHHRQGGLIIISFNNCFLYIAPLIGASEMRDCGYAFVSPVLRSVKLASFKADISKKRES